MKNFEELEEFIKKNLNKNWQEKLKKKPYNLQSVKQFENHPNWWMLVYSLFESDLDNKVVKQSRGTVVEVLDDGTVNVICAPFIKFFDINDVHADKINWSSKKLKCTEKCVSGDTLVETENGIKPIKEVVNSSDKFVLSVNETTGELEFNQIIDRWSKDTNQEWVEIEFESGRKIKITENDAIKLTNGVYRRVSDLSIGDEIVVKD